MARKPLVDRDHFPKYRTICDAIMEGNLENIRFSDKTGESVYSSKELPSVLFKRIGQKNAKQRVLNNIALNAYLAKTGVDGLQVLSASTYKDFLIEDKPFGKGALDTLIAYRLNPSLFDRAVKSLCKLFSFYHCPDLFVKSSDLLKDSPHSKLLLGFKENNESLAVESATLQPILYLTGIQCILEEPTPDLEAKLSSLFPYHKTLIQQELSKLRVSKPKVEASKEPTPPSTYDERLKSSPPIEMENFYD